MSRITWQYQKYREWLREVTEAAETQRIKIIIPTHLYDPFPHVLHKTGRLHFGEGEPDKELVHQGANGAEEYFQWCLPWYRKFPYITEWEDLNEPVCYDAAQCQNLARFIIRWIQLMAQNGYKGVVGHTSVTWPNSPECCLILAEAADCAAKAGFLWDFHEYSAPQMWTKEGAHCLHYRTVIQWWKNVGAQIPQVVIGECGIDGGVEGRAKHGWKSYCSEDQYIEQMRWYWHETSKDPYVQDLEFFVAGPERDWVDFDLTENLSWKMVDLIKEGLPDQPPPPEGDLMDRIMASAEPSTIEMVPGHALFDAILAERLVPCSREGTYMEHGTVYHYQWGYDLGGVLGHPNWRWLYACPRNQWGDIRKRGRAN